jgi:hypothetical protein
MSDEGPAPAKRKWGRLALGGKAGAGGLGRAHWLAILDVVHGAVFLDKTETDNINRAYQKETQESFPRANTNTSPP